MAAPHAIIAGFGIPGRFIAESLDFHGMPYVVIELNAATIERCTTAKFVLGDVRDPQVLARAGVDTAAFLALTFPNDAIVLEAVQIAKRVRPDLRVLARCSFTSAGLKAQQLGAETIVSEQVVAREFFRHIETLFGPQAAPK